jgi:hypothetical protein
VKSRNPHLIKETIILASKTLLSHLGTTKRKLFISFEHYDLTSGKE